MIDRIARRRRLIRLIILTGARDEIEEPLQAAVAMAYTSQAMRSDPVTWGSGPVGRVMNGIEAVVGRLMHVGGR